MGYELRDHTADIEIVGTGDSMATAFAGVGDGMASAMCEAWPDDGEQYSFEIAAESPEALLFDYLDELIFLRDVRNVLPVDNEVEVIQGDDEWQLQATFRGVPADVIDAREIKAPTYADMAITEGDDGKWTASAVLDV